MNILYLGNGLLHSIKAEKFIKKIDCKIVDLHNELKRYKYYPKNYSIGVNFLSPYLVPKTEIDKSIWINFHPAPLPNYGGRNSAYYSLINNEKYFGATIHYINENFDKGDIIEVKLFKIKKSDTAYDLHHKSCNELLELLKKYLPVFLSGEKVIGTPQSNHIYYKKTILDDFIQLNDKTKNEIRAKYCPPYYPKIDIGGKVFKIIQEELNNNEE